MLFHLLSDDQLAWFISRGDASAFGEFFERHKDSILRFCVSRLSRGEAEDAVSDTFIRVWNLIAKKDQIFNDGLHLRRFLFKTAHFTILTYWQKRGHNISLDELLSTGKEVAIVENEAIPPVSKEELKSAMEKLSPESREVLMLRYEGGFSNADISEIIRISPGATNARMSRAHKALRELLIGT